MNKKEILKSFKEGLQKCDYKVEEESKEHIVISMNGFFRPLVDILSMSFRYQPFCQYRKNGRVFVEWQTENWADRYDKLRSIMEVTDLQLL